MVAIFLFFFFSPCTCSHGGFIQMCICTRYRDTKITRSLWVIFSNLWTFFNLWHTSPFFAMTSHNFVRSLVPRILDRPTISSKAIQAGFINLFLSKLHINLSLFALKCVILTLYVFLIPKSIFLDTWKMLCLFPKMPDELRAMKTNVIFVPIELRSPWTYVSTFKNLRRFFVPERLQWNPYSLIDVLCNLKDVELQMPK